MIRALLVEDEESLALAIKVALKRTAIEEVTHVDTLQDARKHIKQSLFNIILLDRTLPDGEGTELLRDLLKFKNRPIPMVLILSARGLVEERIEGLKLGADDYLPKPFALEELLARIEALLRRRQGGQEPHPSEGQALWSLDENHRKLLGPKGWIELTPIEFKLASHLIANEGKVLTREDLLKDVWGFRFLAQTRTVDFFVGKLRKRFEENPNEPHHFLTLRGSGFMFKRSKNSD